MLTAEGSVPINTDIENDEQADPMADENMARLQRFLPESGRILMENGPDLIDRRVSRDGLAQRAAQLAPQKPAYPVEIVWYNPAGGRSMVRSLNRGRWVNLLLNTSSATEQLF